MNLNVKASFKKICAFSLAAMMTASLIPIAAYAVEGEESENEATQSFSVTKVWEDNDNESGTRPESVTINLLNDGSPVEDATITLNEDNQWTYTWDSIEAGTYSVSEDPVEGYKSEVSVSEDGSSAVVTNTLDSETASNDSDDSSNNAEDETMQEEEQATPAGTDEKKETQSFNVTKVWDDDNDAKEMRPEEIEISLTKNGEVVESDDAEVELSEKNNWTYTWTDLESGDYSVKEETVKGYTSKVEKADDGSSAVVTNTLDATQEDTDKSNEDEASDAADETEDTIVYKVTTEWDDENDKHHDRPETVSISLKKGDGRLVGSKVELNKDNDWSYEWSDLEDGKYTIVVDDIQYYNTTVEEAKDGHSAVIKAKYIEDERKGGDGEEKTKAPVATKSPSTGRNGSTPVIPVIIVEAAIMAGIVFIQKVKGRYLD